MSFETQNGSGFNVSHQGSGKHHGHSRTPRQPLSATTVAAAVEENNLPPQAPSGKTHDKRGRHRRKERK